MSTVPLVNWGGRISCSASAESRTLEDSSYLQLDAVHCCTFFKPYGMVPKQFCSSNGGLVWSPALTHETGRGWILPPPPPAVLEISSMLVAECDTRPPEGSAHGMVTLCLVFEYFGCQNRVQLLLGQWVGSRAVAVAICISTKLVYLNFSQPASSFSDFFHCFFHYFLLVPAFFFLLH